MTVPSGMNRTCRTGRSLKVVIFTVGTSVKKEGRGGARRRRPCRDEPRYNRRLKCTAALAADWRKEDDVDGRVEPAFDPVKLCRLITRKRQSSATFVGDRVVRSLLRAGLARPIICTPEELLNDDTEIS
jgi:hypothetical protein